MKTYRVNRIVFSIGAIILGLILLIWPGSSLLILGKCIGAFLAGGGVIAGILYLTDHDSPIKTLLLAIAVIMILAGVTIFMRPDDLISLIPTCIGILVLVSGVINLGETFTLTKYHYGKWWMSLLVAIGTIALGILLITRAFGIASIITRIAGGVLIFDGVTDLWVMRGISHTLREAEAKAEPVDVEAVVIETEVTEPGTAAEPPQKEGGDSLS